MNDNDINSQLTEQIAEFIANKTPCHIQGNGSHGFQSDSPLIETHSHQGIINYEPSELVITVRAGTLISDIKDTLKQHNQQLGTDFPDFGDSTIGGTIAIGTTGSSRPFLGAIRDHVLGLKIINGQAQLLNFGGQVMKNVAGYDVSRLLCGSQGKLALISEVTLKVSPLKHNQTILIDTPEKPLEYINKLAAKPLPISAIVMINNEIIVRLSGSEAANKQATQVLNGTKTSLNDDFWESIDNHHHGFFKPVNNLWELRTQATQTLKSDSQSLINWCGHQRFVKLNDNEPPESVFKGSSYQAFGTQTEQLSPQFLALKNAFDPHNIFK